MAFAIHLPCNPEVFTRNFLQKPDKKSAAPIRLECGRFFSMYLYNNNLGWCWHGESAEEGRIGKNIPLFERGAPTGGQTEKEYRLSHRSTAAFFGRETDLFLARNISDRLQQLSGPRVMARVALSGFIYRFIPDLTPLICGFPRVPF